MMPISFVCPGCQKTLRAKDEMAGRKSRCPYCKTVCTIPELPGVIATPDSAVPDVLPADSPKGRPRRSLKRQRPSASGVPAWAVIPGIVLIVAALPCLFCCGVGSFSSRYHSPQTRVAKMTVPPTETKKEERPESRAEPKRHRGKW